MKVLVYLLIFALVMRVSLAGPIAYALCMATCGVLAAICHPFCLAALAAPIP